MTAATADPIHDCMDRWYRHLRGDLPGGLDTLLHDDVIFLSPIVFTPQVGKDITTLYLTAAGGALGGDADTATSASASGSGEFGYTKTILQGHHAMLEFETTVEGKYVNGVDIITCDDDGMITEFKVMIRPLQAVNLVHAQMQAMLERLAGAAPDGAQR
ncbi:MAG: nuclear transport factor 2 family protein [Ilumatobacter sp.]|nr:nuclear transport factor 2 family protein [Ilumatobacter sp.]